MKNFIRADFHRIMTKRIRILLMILLAIVNVISVLKGISDNKNIIEMTNEVGGLNILYMYGIMLINIFVAYGDDFRARNMQVALGMGVKRHQVVLAKWITLSIIVALDILTLTVLQFIPLIVTGKLAGSFVVGHAIMGEIVTVFTILVAMSLTMIVLFQTQKAILGVLVYIYLTVSATYSIISVAAMNRFVQKFHLWDIGAVNQVDIFISKLWIGQFDIRNFLMVVLYFAIGFGATIYLFRRKELDF